MTLSYERPVFWDVLNGGRPYEPFNWQARHFHAREEKRVIAACGRRSGKSSAMLAEIVREVTRPPEMVHGVEQSPLVYVVGPTAETSMKVWQPVWDAFVPPETHSNYEPPLGFLHQTHDKNRRWIKLHNGAQIYGKTADDPRGLQGDRVTLAVTDESHEIQDEAWDNLMPSLMDSEGRLIAIGIPRGKGRFRSYWELGQGIDPNFYSFSVPTTENPVIVANAKKNGYEIPIDYVRTFDADMTETSFRQHYLAEWVEQDGQVFKNLDQVFDAPPGYAHIGQYNVMGLDIGKMHDYTVAYVGDINTSKFLYRDRFVGLDYSVAVPRIAKMYRAYGCSAIVMDTTGGGIPVRDFLVSVGCHVIDYTYTAKSKEELILTFAREVERGLVHLPKDDKELRREMELFEAVVTGTRVSYNAPKGYFDDCVNAAALLVHLMARRRGYSQNPIVGNYLKKRPVALAR